MNETHRVRQENGGGETNGQRRCFARSRMTALVIGGHENVYFGGNISCRGGAWRRPRRRDTVAVSSDLMAEARAWVQGVNSNALPLIHWRAAGFSFGGVGAPGRRRPEAGPRTQHASGCRESGAGSVPGIPAATTGRGTKEENQHDQTDG